MNKGLSDRSVFVMGGFDDLRTFQIRFLQESAAFGNVHVLLLSDEAFLKKHAHPPKFPEDERRYLLENIRYVSNLTLIDQIAVAGLLDITNVIGSYGLNPALAILEKDASSVLELFCKEHGFEYIVIPETELMDFHYDAGGDETRNPGNKKVMVSGCFDWVHSGHVRFFEEASALGDLYVVVGHDENVRLLKGEGHPMFSQEERQYWVHSIRFVYKALISSGHGWLDAEPEVLRCKPDVFVVNQDGDKPEKKKLFRELGIEYKVLERKPRSGLQARESTILRSSVKQTPTNLPI